MKTNVHILPILFATAFWANSCFAAESDVQKKWSEKVSKENRMLVKDKQQDITAEIGIKMLHDHPWAGSYYHGDGLGRNAGLDLAPQKGVAFSVSGDLGLYDLNYGEVAVEENILKFSFALEHQDSINLSAEYVPVPWGDRVYLIPPQRMIEFCCEINAKKEPRKKAYGSFFLRREDWKKPVEGKPKLPEKYMPYLLDKPVDAKIISLGESQSHGPFVSTKVVLDQGKNAGLLPKMQLAVRKPNSVYEKIVLINVEADRSEGIYQYIAKGFLTKEPPPQIGWQASTYPYRTR